ncbi:MAG: nicotinate phosphoribosyltransferase [Candidatus Aenigmarchaeota archaeon]|nr:nicotinate phosphoribosyltransferase [Candidatus Aenigmarchaeota archaeon]MDW8149123.1 nicotinate phosphoribosyltransferase [Candidatus Aenigmarchaeota archaeon]
MFKLFKNLKPNVDVYSVPEGTVVFPKEPLLHVTGNTIFVQLIETFLLNVLNFQSLIATKAFRCVHAAKNRDVIDFGARRAHSPLAALLAARASYIGGVKGTSLVLAGKIFNIPCYGTVAHKFIQERDSEEEAFKDFLRAFPNSTLVIDTYNTIEGAKKVVKLLKYGYKVSGVRIDSGNLLKLSKKVREIFDKEGFKNVKIIASGDLDEYKIDYLVKNNAPIDVFGVGTRLVTGANFDSIKNRGGVSALNGVYKLVEVYKKKKVVPKFKIGSREKAVPPYKKQIFRIIKNGKIVKDVIGLFDEKINGEKLLVKIIEKGKLVVKLPKLKKIRERCRDQMKMLDEKYKRIRNWEEFPVEYSRKLKELCKKFL